MGPFPRGAIVHLQCPTCLWQKAVLAYEQQGVGTAFCPHCQHLWELALPAKAAFASKVLVFNRDRPRRRDWRRSFDRRA